ncbi:exo-beta-N-acetylmuramidase NamZ family protein [Flavobacterium sp. JP2137]|uniref:exo-beta-N-acetylmuramidase NamZ family protein n=1 Tax=Flavobacterium sp. JP2137 TaxID=3414510 RepID=UPI003D2FD013
MVSNSTFKNTVLFLLVLFVSCGNSTKISRTAKPTLAEAAATPTRIEVGAERIALYGPLLQGKKVGILTNQTGIVPQSASGTSESTVDFLLRNQVNVIKVYAPEHGFRGTASAGEHVKDSKDSKTNLPIISLYGSSKKPSKEQLKDIEVMLFDLQDVGARFYTYISSLHYLMEACAENGIPVIILDRPNPNGSSIDGPVLELANKSFIGMHPIPVLHGMTIGEYGQMINGEKWLNQGIQCKLTVIPCNNYSSDMPYDLPIAPSPNLPNMQSIRLYVSLCFFEGTNVSSGRGTDLQFQIYGSPFLKNMPFSFTPQPNAASSDPMNKGKLCFGENLSKVEVTRPLDLQWLLKAYNHSDQKDRFFIGFFTKLAGTTTLKTQIEKGWTENQIRETWKTGIENFKKTRAPYLLYTK